ncbi:hypothetical protein K438DRAFT_1854661 [Mycena galopus ATCC 62051]|nr:hypothetical protein K438DRAFT_1854661 [Mycena galopus ATCC 62051]
MPPAPEPSERLSGNESSRPSRRPAVVLRASPPSPLAIFCGAQELITWENILESDYDEHRPGIIQILPETLSFVSPSMYKEARTTRSNGCGARSRTLNQRQCWCGEEENVAETVVPLERMYFPQTLREVLDLRDDMCGCVMKGVGCAVCGNPLGAVQTHCSTQSFRGSPALPKSSTYFFVPSAVTPAPSSLPQVPYSNAPASASSASANLFSSEFIQSVANGLDEFVDVGLFRGDADLSFERDFAQWFNPDDVGVLTG